MTWFRWFGVPWGLLLAAGAGYAVFQVLPGLWASCSRRGWDYNAAWSLIGNVPAAAFGVLFVAWISYGLTVTRRRRWVALCAPLISMVLSLLFVWLVIHANADNGMIASDLCPDGAPSWWPTWIPI